MPTTVDEATRITQLVLEYLSADKAAELSRRLDEEIGKQTDNESLQITLQMLRQLLNNEQ